MKSLTLIIFLCGTFYWMACTEQNPVDIDGEPTPPRWVEMTIDIDSLPAVGKTGSIEFQFIVTGKEGSMKVIDSENSGSADTLNYM